MFKYDMAYYNHILFTEPGLFELIEKNLWMNRAHCELNSCHADWGKMAVASKHYTLYMIKELNITPYKYHKVFG